MNKRLIIILISALTIILGILAEFNEIFLNCGLYESESLTHRISPNLQLKLYEHHFTLYNITENIRINYANMLVYLCLFVGVAQVIIKKQERNKLVHFAFTILFIYNVFSLTFGQFFCRLPFNAATSFVWGLISFVAIELSRHKPAITAVSTIENRVLLVPKYIRCLHFVFDPLCFCLIIFEFNYAFALRGFESVSTVFYFLVIYSICELVWGVTPAKILTNTRVIGFHAQDLKRRHIIVRNVLRLIPFEFLSFLFSHNGWHDKYSNTTLVRG